MCNDYNYLDFGTFTHLADAKLDSALTRLFSDPDSATPSGNCQNCGKFALEACDCELWAFWEAGEFMTALGTIPAQDGLDNNKAVAVGEMSMAVWASSWNEALEKIGYYLLNSFFRPTELSPTPATLAESYILEPGQKTVLKYSFSRYGDTIQSGPEQSPVIDISDCLNPGPSARQWDSLDTISF